METGYEEWFSFCDSTDSKDEIFARNNVNMINFELSYTVSQKARELS